MHLLQSTISKIWQHQPEIIDTENNFYLFRFQTEEMALEILTGGPWSLLGGILNLIH